MSETTRLDRAIEIATWVHREQKDRGGTPYIDHPMRVMKGMDDESSRIVAVLHDVLEDAREEEHDDAYNMCEELLTRNEFNALYRLSKKATSERYAATDYVDYVIRISMDPIAAKVKIGDLKDNLDLTRIPNPNDKDRQRNRKYTHALSLLEAVRGLNEEGGNEDGS